MQKIYFMEQLVIKIPENQDNSREYFKVRQA